MFEGARSQDLRSPHYRDVAACTFKDYGEKFYCIDACTKTQTVKNLAYLYYVRFAGTVKLLKDEQQSFPGLPHRPHNWRPTQGDISSCRLGVIERGVRRDNSYIPLAVEAHWKLDMAASTLSILPFEIVNSPCTVLQWRLGMKSITSVHGLRRPQNSGCLKTGLIRCATSAGNLTFQFRTLVDLLCVNAWTVIWICGAVGNAVCFLHLPHICRVGSRPGYPYLSAACI